MPPAILLEDASSEQALESVVRGRAEVVAALTGESKKLVCIVGPCSIHDPVSTLEYAKRLREIADRHTDHLVIVMRAYFEKPRTSTGWKGLVNDPDLDESFHVNKGLRIARRLLLQINEIGLPVGCEFLDTTMPQHIAALVAWGAIGARTTESQIHRQLASGLSMPVGFKNATDGNVQSAVHALLAAAQPHWFPSVTKQGVAAISQSTGNEHCHVILRGGYRSGPNYSAASVAEACSLLSQAGLPQRLMVDCSHGNSEKDFSRQAVVAHDVSCQVSGGSRSVFGVMIESNLVAGRQDSTDVYGQSITDGCIGIDGSRSERIGTFHSRLDLVGGAAPNDFKIIGAMTLLAITFGILHDLFSAAVCVEYFTEQHPRLIESEHWLVMAFLWGIVATWWVGFMGGVWLAICTQVGSAKPLSVWRVMRACNIGAVIVLVLAPMRWFLVYKTDGGVAVPDLDTRLGASEAMHAQSYILATLVFVALGIEFVAIRYRSST